MLLVAQVLGLVYVLSGLYMLRMVAVPYPVLCLPFFAVTAVGVGLLFRKRWSLWGALPIQALQIPVVLSPGLCWRLLLGVGLYLQYMLRPGVGLLDRIAFAFSYGSAMDLGSAALSPSLRNEQFLGARAGIGVNALAAVFLLALLAALRRGKAGSADAAEGR